MGMCDVGLNCCQLLSICTISFSANQLAHLFPRQFQSASPFAHLNKVCSIHRPYRSLFVWRSSSLPPVAPAWPHFLLRDPLAWLSLGNAISLLRILPTPSQVVSSVASAPSVLLASVRPPSVARTKKPLLVARVHPRTARTKKSSQASPHVHAAPASCRLNPFIRSRPLLYVREEHVDI